MRRKSLIGMTLLVGGAVAFLGFIGSILASGTSTPQVNVYVAARGIPIGQIISPADLRPVKVGLPNTTSANYFLVDANQTPAKEMANRDIPPGALISKDMVEDPAKKGKVAVPIQFVLAPALQAGDTVDIFTLGDDQNPRGVIPLMQNVTLLPSGSAAGGGRVGFVIEVTPDQVPALIFASANLKLAAVLVIPGTKSTDLQPVFTSSEAEQALASGSH